MILVLKAITTDFWEVQLGAKASRSLGSLMFRVSGGGGGGGGGRV